MEIKNILCPTDFSDISKSAIDYAVSMARSFDAKLILMHSEDQLHGFDQYQILALTPHEIAEKMLKQAEAELEQIAGNIAKDIKVETAVRQGKAFVEIIQMAAERDVDLIVMGSHGRTGLSHAMLGSVAEKVVRKAPCPVLIAKEKK